MPRPLLRTLTILLAAGPALGMAWGLFRFGVDVPFYDQWHEAPLIFRFHDGALTLAELWKSYNHHRLFFARLVTLPLSVLSGWDNALECRVSWLLGVAALGLSWRWLRLGGTGSPAAAKAAWLFLFSLLIFTPVQLPRWLYGFHLQTSLSVTAAMLGLNALLSQRFGLRGLILAAACGIVSSFSFSSGLAFWPAALILLASQDYSSGAARLRAVAAWIAISALAGFVHTYDPAGGIFSSDQNRSLDPGLLLPALCAYAANPFLVELGALKWIGAAGVGFWIAEFVFLCRGRANRSRTVFLALGGFSLGTGLLIAAARGNLGLDNFLAIRYFPLQSLFWISIFGMLASRLPQSRLFRAGAWVLWFAAALFLLRDAREGWSYFRKLSGDFHAAAARVRAGDLSDASLEPLYPLDPSVPRAVIPELRRRRLSLFRESETLAGQRAGVR